MFLLTINQLFVLFAFIAFGYILRKKNIVSDEASAVLSQVEMCIFMPAFCFNAFSSNLRIDVLKEKLFYVMFGAIVITVTIVFGILISKAFSKEKFEQNVFAFSLVVSNFGYMGYPLIAGVFGEEALFNAMLLSVSYNIFVYSFGMQMLNPKGEYSIRKLFNPNTIAMLVGTAVGLLNISLPEFVNNTVEMGSNCMAPIAMILTGCVLANVGFKSLVTDYKTYIIVFMRLILIPVVIGGAAYLLGISSKLIIPMAALLAMPVGTNTIVFTEVYGGDNKRGVQLCFMSNCLCIITVPVIFWLLSFLG